METTDGDQTFPVGLLYGPSGSGKSSLLKAGLLPRALAPHVIAIYVEATAQDTEARLLKGLRKRLQLPPGEGLVAALAGLRRGHGLAAGRKVLLVLDQFEQWLHARSAAKAEVRLGTSRGRQMRWRTGAGHCPGARRLLDGGDRIHARAGVPARRRQFRGRQPL